MLGITELNQMQVGDHVGQPTNDLLVHADVIGVQHDAQLGAVNRLDDLERRSQIVDERPFVAATGMNRFERQADAKLLRDRGDLLQAQSHSVRRA